MSIAPEGGEDDAFLEDIYQQITPGLADEAERDFKPWHKPRKHYLRVKQWCALFRELIGDIGYGEGEVVRYLGLPGEDFLDIRTLEGVCNRAKVTLKYLGFDSSADTGGEYEMLLSKHEIASFPFVDPFSVLARDRIERLASESSTACDIFEKVGPFDVINLDICDSIVSSVGEGSYFDALGRLCDLQLSCGRAKPWLLFLSTRAIRAQFEITAKEQLLKCILGNVDASSEFADILGDRLSLSAIDLEHELASETALEHSALVRAIAVGLGKWLLKLTMSAQPRVSVRLLQSYSYRVETSDPDMLSLAFRFEPIIEPRKDSSGLAPTRASAGSVASELELAKELVEGVADIRDVDQLLADDPALNARFVERSADMLASVRYNRDAYIKWVNDGPTFGSADHPDLGRLGTASRE